MYIINKEFMEIAFVSLHVAHFGSLNFTYYLTVPPALHHLLPPSSWRIKVGLSVEK